MVSLSPFPIRRKHIIRREFKVHVFSTLMWWALWSVLVVAGSLINGGGVPWVLLATGLPLIAIMESVFFIGSVLRR